MEVSVLSFTPGPIYLWEKTLQYPLDRRLAEVSAQSGRCGEDGGESKPYSSVNQPVTRRYTDCIHRLVVVRKYTDKTNPAMRITVIWDVKS
jgi:hypothetical protein